MLHMVVLKSPAMTMVVQIRQQINHAIYIMEEAAVQGNCLDWEGNKIKKAHGYESES